MVKLLKIIAKMLGGTIEWVLILVITFAFAIRTSPVQTYLAKIATEFLSEELNTTIKIDEVDIVFVDRVDLKGVLILDEKADTLANIQSLLVNVSGLSAFTNKIYIDNVNLDGGVVKISREAKTGDYNYWFIQDYFDSGKPTKKSKSPPVKIKSVSVSNLRFYYDDYRKTYSERGMDFDHLAFKSVNLKVNQIVIKKGIISAVIHSFSAVEKCGFELTRFNSYVLLSDRGMALKKMNIVTPQSKIQSNDFNFLYSGYTDFREFVDSVEFDVTLLPSKVSLKDIAYFAPALTGMDQQVLFSGKASKFVKDLKIENFILATGDKTVLKGTINLPDYRELTNSFYQERIEYAFVDLKDLQAMRMPDDYSSRYLIIDPSVQRLEFFEAKDVRLDGIFSQFVLSSENINTAIGSANLDNGIFFTRNEANNSFFFKQSIASAYDVKVNQFQLNRFLGDNLFGVVDGTFFLSGEAFSFSDIHFTSIQGDINQFNLADYSYSNITLKEGSIIDKIITAKAVVNDNNLNLEYSGSIDLNGEPKLNMTIDLQKALLSKLKLTDAENVSLVGQIELDVIGLDPNKMRGDVVLNEINYIENGKEIKIPSLVMNVTRNSEKDMFTFTSSLISGYVEGKIDFNEIGANFQEQFSDIFPGLYTYTRKKRKDYDGSKDFFRYDLTTGNLVDFFAVFIPKLNVSPGTRIVGSYNGQLQNFDMKLLSNQMIYDGMVLSGIDVNQSIANKQLNADYHFVRFKYNDSISIDNITFKSSGNGNNLLSNLSWNPASQNETEIQWRTNFASASKIIFDIEPSYLSINEMRWDISNQARISLDSSDLEVIDFRLKRNDQFIAVNGHVSKNDNEKLKFELNEIDLEEISILTGLSTHLSGKLNGWGYITNPYTNLAYMGDLNIIQLKVNQEEVGDVYVLSEWDRKVNTVGLQGEILYKGIQSFDFSGYYYANKETDNLDFNLLFDETNIAFTNAFLDPKVISDISGFVNGSLKVKGSPLRPILEGEVFLENASAKLAILGTSFYLNGKVKADEDGFYIDHMPVSDVEGNTGSLIGSIYHSDYKDWNFDVAVNLEDDAKNKDLLQPWRPIPLKKFLVMNTPYKEGEIYYGKGYATGTAEIFGYSDNLEITVNLKTQKGTWINFPMYGSGDLKDGADFITFKTHDSIVDAIEKKIDFTGVDLDLNFEVTKDADLKIIFNEQLGDEIIANGYGNIGIRLNQAGDLAMDGTYFVAEGSKYNFAMGPVKQTFYIVDGGNITWTGNPYEASLDLSTYYKVRASLAELSADQVSSGMQEVQCYLNLSESLMKPTIGFDIKVPKADESGKALVARVTSDKDELNRQFFSLLLTKNFQPLKGGTTAGGSAALDLVSSQINSLLDQVSQGYKLNVDLSSDHLAGNEVAFGVSKGFLDDRLIVTGSFGVENNTTGEQSKSELIGDLEVEYKLNESGTFRVSVFNESNDNSIIQNPNQGRFSQGAGISYREDFNSVEDFKVLQSFLDIFRKKENKKYPIKRKKQQTPVPKETVIPEEMVKPEEAGKKT